MIPAATCPTAEAVTQAGRRGIKPKREYTGMKNRSLKKPAKRSKQKSNIWIIEDNTLFRECVKELINGTPDLKCTRSFDCCEDALRRLESGPSPDVLLLDIGLPGMSGLEGIQKFKEFKPSIQIIIITVAEGSDTVFQAICTGASGYLLKSASQGKIIEAIRDVLSGGSPINAQIARKVLVAFAALTPPSSEEIAQNVLAKPFSSRRDEFARRSPSDLRNFGDSHKDYGLTDREQEILMHLTNGLTKKEIGKKIFLSHHTIDTHIRSIYNRLHVNNRSGAIVKALKEHLL